MIILKTLAKPLLAHSFFVSFVTQMSRPNFDALRELHECANDRLHIHSPIIQQALVHHHQEKWVQEISESALRILDVCSLTKDVLLLVKQHLQDLQSTIRRTSIGETGFESKLAAYDLFRKKLKKEMVKWLRSLKGTKKNKPMIISDQLSVVDHNLVAVGNVLGEVRETTISIVDSLQSLMSIPRPKSGSLALKLMRMSNGQNQNVYERYDAKTFEAVEMAIDDIGFELECIFRRLIQTRVSLLNILSPAS